MKPCPYCAELIQDQAAKCRYCGEWLDPSKRPAWSQEAKAAAIATAPTALVGDRSIDDDDDDEPRHEGPGSTLPVGSGVPDLGRREPEPPRTWSAPAWLANAQAARNEQREELPPTDRSTLEEVALRMERIRQSAAAVRESVEPTPRAVRPAAPVPERATLEVEPGVTLPAGSLRAVGIEPREPATRAPRGREPARAVAYAPKAAPVVHEEEDDLADFEDEPAPRTRPRVERDDHRLRDYEDEPAPRQRPRAERDELVLRSERPTVPDIPREQLFTEAEQAESARRRHEIPRSERPTKRIVIDVADDDLEPEPAERTRKRKTAGAEGDELGRSPRKAVAAEDDELGRSPRRAVGPEGDELGRPSRKASALPPEPELPGPPTERVRVRGKAVPPEPELHEPPPTARKTYAAVPPPVELDDELDDEEAADDELPPPRAGGAAFDDDFLDEEDEDGEDDGYEGEGGFESFAGAGPAPRPLPWRPILIGAAVIVVAGLALFRDTLFPSDPETDEVAEGAEGGDASEEKGEPKAKPEPAPKVEGQGQPVQPDAKAGADGGTVVADAGQPPQPAQPAAPDADTVAKLDEARKAYNAANGNARKLQPVGQKLQEILAKAPDNADALTLMAQVYLEQGKMDDSLKASNRCTEVAPSSAACWLTIGVIQETKGADEIARLAYQKYLALAPDGRYANDAQKALGRLK